MSVRAKFKVSKLSTYESGATEIELQAVVGGSEENNKFFKYTPSGNIKLNTVNPNVADIMIPGTEFYVDFVKAEK